MFPTMNMFVYIGEHVLVKVRDRESQVWGVRGSKRPGVGRKR